MDASASTLAPEIGGVKLSCASNPMRVLNRLLAPTALLASDIFGFSQNPTLSLVGCMARLISVTCAFKKAAQDLVIGTDETIRFINTILAFGDR